MGNASDVAQSGNNIGEYLRIVVISGIGIDTNANFDGANPAGRVGNTNTGGIAGGDGNGEDVGADEGGSGDGNGEDVGDNVGSGGNITTGDEGGSGGNGLNVIT
ncbi:MAG: hypothetical protein LBB18_03085 [Puniceicoccales bacterium]|nr:hypothetical protein [Puniceicoccales bacterium]